MRDLMTLPKAELHLHIEGTLEPELAFELAAKHGITLPYVSIAELRAAYSFDDLQSFLDLYYATMAVLRDADDFERLTSAYLARAAAQGLRHVEVFFDPQAHTSRGVPLGDVIDGITAGLARAERELGITSGLILSFLRDLSVESALETFAEVGDRMPLLSAVGLDSAEVGHRPGPFSAVFALAREAGLRVVAHAGEEAGPEYVWEALTELRVDRVDHGVQSVHDAELLAHLRDHRIPLTMCPLSNERLRVFDSVAQHPILDLLESGLVVTVNSDDPSYFGGYVGDNFVALRTHLGMTDDQAARLAENSVTASFAGDARKAELRREIEAWRTA